jgi:hypothetical protein
MLQKRGREWGGAGEGPLGGILKLSVIFGNLGLLLADDGDPD